MVTVRSNKIHLESLVNVPDLIQGQLTVFLNRPIVNKRIANGITRQPVYITRQGTDRPQENQEAISQRR